MLEGSLAPCSAHLPTPELSCPPRLTTRLARTHLHRIPALCQDGLWPSSASLGSVPLPGLKGPKVKERDRIREAPGSQAARLLRSAQPDTS